MLGDIVWDLSGELCEGGIGWDLGGSRELSWVGWGSCLGNVVHLALGGHVCNNGSLSCIWRTPGTNQWCCGFSAFDS